MGLRGLESADTTRWWGRVWRMTQSAPRALPADYAQRSTSVREPRGRRCGRAPAGGQGGHRRGGVVRV